MVSMPTDDDITHHHDGDPDDAIWLAGGPLPGPVVIVEHDPAWHTHFTTLADRIRSALGPLALTVEHVGSTSVPGLAAKPVIDIDLTVADPADESAYRGALEAAGFVLVVREPGWHEHRCFRLDAPAANLHVFGPGCPETIRHRMFRDWLRIHPEDRALYREAKEAAAAVTNDAGGTVMDYNARKEDVIRGIYARAFASAGLTGSD